MKWLREKFAGLDPKQKKWAVLLLLGSVLMAAGYMGFAKRQQNRSPEVVVKEKPHDVGIGKDLLEKSLVREQRKEAERTQAEIAELRARLEQLGGQPQVDAGVGGQFPPPPVEKVDATSELRIPSAEELAGRDRMPPIPPPPPHASSAALGGFRPPPPPGGSPAVAEEEIGGIGSLTNTDLPQSGKEKPGSESKKKEQTGRSIYLPPSFFQAELISGGDISTSGQASNNPEPFFLRIQTPAQLPNDVKLRLSGCFVVAEGTGRLDKERAMIRTVSLGCLGKNGESIIDEPIKGYVADVDAKNGLAGKVVSKMGATIARTFLAGLAEGTGRAFEASAQTQTISGLTGTSTTIVDSGNVARSAVGSGVAEASKTLKDFYLDLAKNTTPVIEILASRKVTVFITEGKHLSIKDAAKGEEP